MAYVDVNTTTSLAKNETRLDLEISMWGLHEYVDSFSEWGT